jgi:P4 family phage/plasmid primase-like protien
MGAWDESAKPGPDFNIPHGDEEQTPEGPTIEQHATGINFDEITVLNDKGKPKISPTKAAHVVLDRMPLVTSEDSEDIYRFNGQIYKPDGARIIDGILCAVVGDLFNAYQKRETLRRITNDLLNNPVVFEPDPYILAVKNGVADLRTGEVREYRPEDLLLEQLDVTHDADARCPAFLAFLESITPNVSDRITLIDWFVATAIKVPLAYVLFLLGLGRNGKGIYEKLIKKFFGKAAFRDMPLAEVGKNNFAAGGFHRKSGWIASETGKRNASIGTDFIKLTSGNGSIDSDRKNQSRIQFEPYFQTIVDTNTMPKIEDSSIGWQERFVKVDLPFIFVPNPNKDNPLEKQRDPDLFEKLSAPDELSGILNLLLFRSKAIGKSRTIHKRAGEEMFAEYAEQSSSVTTFLEMFCEYNGDLSGLWTPSEPIYEAYRTWCGYKVGEVVDIRYFGKQLKKFCGGFEPKRGKTKDRKSTSEYRGLIFDNNKCKEALEALQLSMSHSVSMMSQSNLNEEEKEQSQQIRMSQLSQSIRLWNEIIERFGLISSQTSQTSQKEPQNTTEIEKENLIETIETIETSASSEPVGREPNRDTTETLIETKPTIEADILRAEEERKAKEDHARELAAKYTKKRIRSYSEMARSVPFDTSSPEAVKICRSFRGLLTKGMAPRIDFLVKETGLPKESIEGYLNSAPWIRKDDSSPAGIVVYLPLEASA